MRISVPALLATALLTLTACHSGPASAPAPSPAANPATAGFGGRFYVLASSAQQAAGGLFELSLGTTVNLTATQVATDITYAAALSPDGRTLAYVQDRGLVLRDVATGKERVLRADVKGTVTMCGWSPDGRRLSVLDNDLVVVGVDGSLTTIADHLSDWYTPEGGSGRDIYSGELGCGSWIDGDRLVFDRLRALPRRLAEPSADHIIDADATTVAVLGGGKVRLVDSATRWRSLGACGGRLATVEQAAVGTVHILDHPATGALTAAGGAAPASASIDGAQIKTDVSTGSGVRIASTTGDFAFVPPTCRPVTSRDDGIHAIDLATHSVVPKVLIGADPLHNGFDLASPYATWNSSAGAEQIAYFNGDSVQLTDLHSGRRLWATVGDQLTTITPVGWVPPAS